MLKKFFNIAKAVLERKKINIKIQKNIKNCK